MFRVLDRLTIKKRLFLVIASILILISIMVLSIWIGFRAINHKNSIALLLEKEAVYLQAVARGLSEFIVTQGTPASVKLTEEAMGKFDETCNTLVSELGETDTAIAITEKVIPKWKKIKGAAESLLQIQRDALTDEAMIKFGRLSAEIDLLLKDTQSIAESVRKRADSDTGRILTAIAIIVVAIILAVSLLLISTYRSVSVPIKTLTEATQKIASGDLEVNIEVSSTDEIGILASAFNSMASEIKQSHEEQRMLYEKEQRKVHQMAVLQEAVSDTASDLALEPLLERQAFHAAILVKAELSGLVTIHPETRAIQYFKTNVPQDTFPVKRLPEGKGLLGVVLKEGISIRLDKASSDPRFEGLPAGHPFIGSLLGIPLLLVIGGLFVANKQGGEPFTQEDEDLLLMLGLQAVTAIENARLYTKTVELATTDELTGVSNRRVFMEELSREAARAGRYNLAFSLLMIDIDHFKWVNDSHGHPAGDAVLKSLARILKGQVRQVDIVARYGGEEFAIILPETSIDGARVVGERIRAAIASTPFSIDHEKNIGVTVSVGISCFPESAQSVELLIERADQALYTAKREGRNRVCLYHETLIAMLEHNPMEIASLLNNDLNNIQTILAVIDIKATFFRDHTEKVEHYASLLSQALNLDDTERERLRLACLLHDIGVVTIRSAILEKPDAFTEEGWEIIKEHPAAGAKIIENVPALQHLAPVIHSHHEWYDGKGYPDRLKGNEIPYLSRIIAVADAYAAMTSEMPWYKTVSKEEAKEVLKAGAGSQFDPEIVETFCRYVYEKG